MMKAEVGHITFSQKCLSAVPLERVYDGMCTVLGAGGCDPDSSSITRVERLRRAASARTVYRARALARSRSPPPPPARQIRLAAQGHSTSLRGVSVG